MTILGLSHRRAIIVGAGQAGLAVASALRAAGLAPQRDFAIIDANPRGERSWASRADSMQLLTDAQHSAIGGVPLPSDPARRPYPPEMERYLTAVETSIGVATMWGIRATGVEHRGTGSTLLLRTAEGAVQTRNVVCATGFASRPSLPAWASGLIVPGVILHSADYRLSRQIPQGDVLIIGGGDSGTQVAGELLTPTSSLCRPDLATGTADAPRSRPGAPSARLGSDASRRHLRATNDSTSCFGAGSRSHLVRSALTVKMSCSRTVRE